MNIKHLKTFLLILFVLKVFFLNAQNQTDVDLNFPLDTFNNEIKTSAIQVDGKILVGGSFTSYNGTNYNRLIRLNSDGSPDNTFEIGVGFNGSVETVIIQPDGKILVGGNFTSYNGTTQGNIIRLNQNGTKDTTFNVNTGFIHPIYYSSVSTIKIQNNGKILVGGSFSTFNDIPCKGIVRLNNDGTIDNSFTFNINLSGISAIEIQTDGKILAGAFGNYLNNTIVIGGLIRLNSNGTIDNTFNIGTGSNAPICSIKIQTDGKIIIGGQFDSFNGLNRARLLRLNTDGSVDTSFNNGSGFTINDACIVYDILIQSDGKIVIGGSLSVYNGSSQGGLIRLLSDGIFDATFNGGQGVIGTVYSINIDSNNKLIIGGNYKGYQKNYLQPIRYNKRYLMRLNQDGLIDENFITVKGFDEKIKTIKLQLDGKLLIGGGYYSYNRVLRNKLSRLNNNGEIDNSFNIGTGFNEEIETIEVTSNGKIFVGGQFTNFNGNSQNRLIKLNENGTIDNSFNIGNGFNENVLCIALQQDGKILVGGWFTQFNGVNKNFIARLNSDGSLDSSFNIGTGFNGEIRKIIVQADGKIIIGGYFSNYNGVVQNNLVRLNQDGSLDNSFTIGSGFNGRIMTFTQQISGKIVVGGEFTNFNGIGKNYVLRLNVNGDLDSTFNMGNGFNSYVSSVKNLENGKILIVGEFTQYNGSISNRIIQLNQDGTVDYLFNIGNGFNHDVNEFLTNFETNSLEVQQDGKIWICGQYSIFNNIDSNSLIRIKGLSVLNNNILNIEKQINIFPNPTNSSLCIDLGAQNTYENVYFHIYNNIGQTIHIGKIKSQITMINLDNFITQYGLYFIKIYNGVGENIITKKIVFNK